MFVELCGRTRLNLDLEPDEAFRVLCKTLNMNCAAFEETEMFARKDDDGETRVYYKVQDRYEVFDDRGELFIALRNLAKLLG